MKTLKYKQMIWQLTFFNNLRKFGLSTKDSILSQLPFITLFYFESFLVIP